MRLLLLFLCISCVTITAHAQALGSSDTRWSDGCVYYANGTRLNGMIDRNISMKHGKYGIPYILFKVSKKAGEVKMFPDSVRTFICGPDSFVVAHYINDSIPVFVKVLMNEPVKLYEADKLKNTQLAMVGNRGGFTSISETYAAPRLYFGEDPDHLEVLTRKNFKVVMSKVLVKRAALLEKINSKEFEYDDLEDIVSFYNGMRLEDTRTKN